MPNNFWIITIVQGITFVVAYILAKKKKTSLLYVLPASVCFGIVLGIFFDITQGVLGNYSYITAIARDETTPWVLTPIQLIINGAVSFGLTVATVYYLLPQKQKLQKKFSKKLAIVLGGMVLVTPVALRFLLEGGLVSLFAAGICIILLGEVAMVMLSYEGPIISFLLRKEYSAFLKIWLVSIVVGVICEGANYFFPFWEWLPGEGYSWMLLETLIILFGYLVVIHPMIIFWQTIDDKGDEKKTKKS